MKWASYIILKKQQPAYNKISVSQAHIEQQQQPAAQTHTVTPPAVIQLDAAASITNGNLLFYIWLISSSPYQQLCMTSDVSSNVIVLTGSQSMRSSNRRSWCLCLSRPMTTEELLFDCCMMAQNCHRPLCLTPACEIRSCRSLPYTPAALQSQAIQYVHEQHLSVLIIILLCLRAKPVHNTR